MKLNIFTDGGSRGNPGPAAVGVVIKDAAHKTLHSFGQTIGIATNNAAEYEAVIVALQWLNTAKKFENCKLKIVNFYLDSQLVVNQLNGLWKLKEAGLRQKVILIRRLEAGLDMPITFTAIPREQNSQADLQVNLAFDQQF